jgi:hypothetical protein
MNFAIDDDFEDLFGPPINTPLPPPEDRVPLHVAGEISGLFAENAEKQQVTVFYDGQCRILQSRPQWLGNHWGAVIYVDHSASKYAIVIVPGPDLVDVVRFDPSWVKFPMIWKNLTIDGSGKTGDISHLDIGYFIPRGAVVTLSQYGLLEFNHCYTNIMPPLSNEHCVVIHGGIVYEIASYAQATGQETTPRIAGTQAKPKTTYVRCGDSEKLTESHYRGAQPSGCYNSLCDLSPGNITVYKYENYEFITKSSKPGVHFIWIDIREGCWYYAQLEKAEPVENWDSLEWNTIPGFPDVDLSLGTTTSLYSAEMKTYSILLDNTVIARPSGGEYTAITIEAGLKAAASRFDDFADGVLVTLKENKITMTDYPETGYWVVADDYKPANASLEFIKFYEHLWIASTQSTGYLKVDSKIHKVPPRRYTDDSGKQLSIVVPRFHEYNMDLTGGLFPVLNSCGKGYTIQNLNLHFDDFPSLKTYVHHFKPGTYAVGTSSIDWTYTEGPEFSYTCEGHKLPHFTNDSIVKAHYAKFESVCKQVRDNVLMARMMDNTAAESVEDNVVLDTNFEIVPTYELPLPEPEKPAVVAAGTVLPEDVKTALANASAAVTKLSSLFEASQKSVASRIEELTKKADSIEKLLERMVAIEQQLRESE